MLPGFVLMLGLSVLYVQADLAEHLDELFNGLKAAVGALIARALGRLSRSFITDVPLALLAAMAGAVSLGLVGRSSGRGSRVGCCRSAARSPRTRTRTTSPSKAGSGSGRTSSSMGWRWAVFCRRR